MIKKTVVQMKDQIFSGKDSMSVMAFLQDFKFQCDACNIHGGATVWLSMQFLTGDAEPVVTSRITSPRFAVQKDEGALQSYY